jgi:hypothetical protein
MYSHVKENFPNCDVIMRDCFMLGVHHGLTVEDVDYVCEILKEYYPGIMNMSAEERPYHKYSLDTCAASCFC